jgi:hypothetical protein
MVECGEWSRSLRPILRYAIIPHAEILRIYAPFILSKLINHITMLKQDNEKAHTDVAPRVQDNKIKASTKQVRKYLLDIGIVLAMCVLLFYAISTLLFNPRTDAGRYQCYALIFWKGMHAIDALPPEQCSFLHSYSSTALIESMKSRGVPAGILHLMESQSTSDPLHILPYEYPLLSIVPFSLGLIAPPAWYQVAFAIWMLLLAAIIYILLKKTRSTSAAIVFAFYLVLGSWGSAAARFDIVPAGLILGAVILAARTRWKWAFALLALATMFKFFPIILLVPFLIAQQMQYSHRWYSLRRWSALGVYLGICAVLTLLSLALNIVDTLSPIGYFLNRPIQIESTPAALLWLGSFLGYSLQFVYSFGSLNVISHLSNVISLSSLACAGAGLLYTFWLQWRGKLDIYTASLITVLIIMVTGKVFSPQYLIWIAPLLAFIGGANWKWLITWGSVGLLTTWIWPNMYYAVHFMQVPLLPEFYPVVLVRSLILLGLIIVLLYQATRKSFILKL